jgi:hypothetical protein
MFGYSSSTVFQTGSVYQVDVILAPGLSGSGITVDGLTEGGILGNNGGSLTNTGSLFVGNFSQNNTQNFSGSIYTIKTYSRTGFTLPATNFNATATRLSKQPIPQEGLKVFELLVVAGGGGGGNNRAGGGGAGGLQYFSNFIPTVGRNTVIVGNGGAPNINGQNSVFSTYISIGGGNGTGGNGGSGGGGVSGGSQPGGIGTVGQGTNGGAGLAAADEAGGGGGGASTSGNNATNVGGNRAGDGGSGSFIAPFAAIGGSPAGWFAGGGGGSISYGTIRGFGGIGGGGNGSGIGNIATTASINTGGGGGGGGVRGPATAGGSGIVAIRYSGPQSP